MKRLLLTCLLLAACTSDPGPRTASPAPSPEPSPTPSASAAAVDDDDLLVAVVRRSGGVELHRVERTTRAAALERVLVPPQEGAKALDVTLSSTTVCAAFSVGEGEPDADPPSQAACYPAGASKGTVVQGPEQPVEVALSADGTRLAWAEHTPGGNQVVAVARVAGGVLTGARRFFANAGLPPDAFNGTGVNELAWTDPDALAISTGVESDDGPNLLRFDVASPGDRGWLDEGQPVRTPTRGYLTYDLVVSASGGEALAVERGSSMDEARRSRAVRVDLANGAVLDVLATAAEGRDVLGVSGSREAVVYVTGSGSGPVTAYLRLAGEQRGTPITGLPEDAEQVVTTGRSG